MDLFDIKQRAKKRVPLFKRERKPRVPFLKETPCPICNTLIPDTVWRKNLLVCTRCGHHRRMHANERIKAHMDKGSFKAIPIPTGIVDPLGFPDYTKKQLKYQQASKLEDAIVIGTGTIEGESVAMAIMESHFMMGSMGMRVGDAIANIAEIAHNKDIPLIIFCASGGARMQEGLYSLMQMAKTSLAVDRLRESGQLYVSVLTDPTTGGVTASFAMQGDIIIAEQGALIGFAGARVIKQTIGEDLPEGFQKAEFLQECGFVDRVENRRNLTSTLARILKLHNEKAGCDA